MNHVKICVQLKSDYQFVKTMASNSKKFKLAMIHDIFPEEIMVLIFKNLDFKSLTSANKVCSSWRKIMHGFNLFDLGNFGKFTITN